MPTTQRGSTSREPPQRHGIRIAAITTLVAVAVAAIVVIGAWWAGTRGTPAPTAHPPGASGLTPSGPPSPTRCSSPTPTSPGPSSTSVGRLTGWQSLDPGPLSPRRDAAVVATDRWVVVAGGRAAGRALLDAAAYDVATGSWRMLPDVPAVGAGADAGASSGSRVVVAGPRGAVALGTETGRWSTLADSPFPTGRRIAVADSVVTLDVAATGPSLPLARLDADSGTWVALPALPLAEVDELLNAGGQLVAVGRAGDSSTSLRALALSGSRWHDLGLPQLPWQYGHLAAGDAVSLYVWAGGAPGRERPADHGVAVALASGRWREIADVPTEWWECYGSAVTTGPELLIDACATVLAYDPSADEVRALGTLPPSVQSTAPLVVVSGRPYRWGAPYCVDCPQPPPAVAFTRW